MRLRHFPLISTPTLYSPWLTIVTLLPGPQVMPATLPSPPLTPPRTRRLPSLCLWKAFPTCLRQHLPSLCLYSARPTCLLHCLPSLCSQCPPEMPPMPPSHCPNNPYAPEAPPISALTTLYASAPPRYLLCRLQLVRSRRALKIFLLCRPQPPLCLM
ncbi:hypothetical protein O181_080000 [Austropuccinia psidii MF-1]|uniref:Uncharacterized protein n=1 Tax=Austropuccinia psidii MF-1 TaxID=1389203 RepID=A0A9Q3FG28_9BASI|nr:hypothetical protein [Austropuccinia psidii MF-1]